MRRAALLVLVVAATALRAAADDVAVLDLTGVQIRDGQNVARSSAPDSIDRGYGYRYAIDGMVQGSGVLLGLLFPNPTPLAQALETLAPGSSEFLTGETYNPGGELPIETLNQTFAGQTVVLGITVTYSMTFSGGIDVNGYEYFNLTNVVLTPATLVGSLTFTSGSATLTRIPAIPADMNYDGLVDNGDIDSFTLALLDPAAYTTQFGYDPIYAGDVNRDFAFDNGDIDGFVSCLLAGGCD